MIRVERVIVSTSPFIEVSSPQARMRWLLTTGSLVRFIFSAWLITVVAN